MQEIKNYRYAMDLTAGIDKIVLKKFFLKKVNFSTGFENYIRQDFKLDDIELEDIEIIQYNFFDFVNHKRIVSDPLRRFINFKVMTKDGSYRYYKVTNFHPLDILKYVGKVEMMAELDLGNYGLECERTGEYRDADIGDIDDNAIKEFLFNNKENWNFIYETQ